MPAAFPEARTLDAMELGRQIVTQLKGSGKHLEVLFNKSTSLDDANKAVTELCCLANDGKKGALVELIWALTDKIRPDVSAARRAESTTLPPLPN